jgi:CRISPR-associated protein Cmr5
MARTNQVSRSTNADRQTLEQQRAADACVQGKNKDYSNLAKGLPALIMSSGLLQVMAFLHEKGLKDSQRHCSQLGDDLCRWVHKRFPDVPADFTGFMKALIRDVDPRTFQAITAESLAWLRWLRQIAPAVIGEGR